MALTQELSTNSQTNSEVWGESSTALWRILYSNQK